MQIHTMHSIAFVTSSTDVSAQNATLAIIERGAKNFKAPVSVTKQAMSLPTGGDPAMQLTKWVVSCADEETLRLFARNADDALCFIGVDVRECEP